MIEAEFGSGGTQNRTVIAESQGKKYQCGVSGTQQTITGENADLAESQSCHMSESISLFLF